MKKRTQRIISLILLAILALLAVFVVVYAAASVAAAARYEQEDTIEPTTAEVVTEPTEAGADTEPTYETMIPTEPLATEEPEETTPPYISLGEYVVTAYCSCEKCCGYWATIRPLDENGEPIVYTSIGAVAKAGVTIAVDPSVIPYGTTVFFEGPDGMNEYIAQDTGGGIKGSHIDLYFDDHTAAREWGVKRRELFVRCGDDI